MSEARGLMAKPVVEPNDTIQIKEGVLDFV
jgi:hypothetical protein